MLSAWVVSIGLILLNAVYVAAEFASVAARSSQIRKLANEGDRIANALLKILEDPRRLDEYIAVCQVGITFSSLLLGAYTELSFGPDWAMFLEKHLGAGPALSESIASVGILLSFTLLQILFGELLPKSLALQNPDRLAMFMYFPLRLSTLVFRPFTWFLNGSGNFILNLLGVASSSHKHIHSLEEIELLLAESKDGGLLEPEEHDRLQQALLLGDKTARQLMTPRHKILSSSINSDLDSLYQDALRSPYTRLLIHGDTIDDIVGVVNQKDVIRAKLCEKSLGIQDLLRPVPIVPENLTLGRLIVMLKSSHSHIAVVMDEHGATRGIVTGGDVLSELIPNLEADEFKHPESFEVLLDGRIRLPGLYKLHRLSRLLGKIPDCEAETVNGLLVDLLERIPEAGDCVELEDVFLEVESVNHNAANQVIVRRKSEIN